MISCFVASLNNITSCPSSSSSSTTTTFFSIQLYLTPPDWLALRPDENERDSSIHYTNVSRSRVPAGLQPTRKYNTINQRIGITGPGGGAPPHRRVFVDPQHTKPLQRSLLFPDFFFLSLFPKRKGSNAVHNRQSTGEKKDLSVALFPFRHHTIKGKFKRLCEVAAGAGAAAAAVRLSLFSPGSFVVGFDYTTPSFLLSLSLFA